MVCINLLYVCPPPYTERKKAEVDAAALAAGRGGGGRLFTPPTK